LEVGGVNLYVFVGNNCVMRIDPYGNAWIDWIPDIPQPFVDFGAGLGDSLSFGLTDWARDKLGLNDVVNPCSGAYGAGEWAGVGTGVALGGVGGLGRAAGKEFSHWIPDRLLRKTGSDFLRKTFGRSPLDGNYVSPARHFKHDPYRFPGGNNGSKLPPIVQQLDRIPTAAASGVYAGEGAFDAANGDDCD
jgi:hypothetical protein